MCVIMHKEYIALMLLTAYRAPRLRVNMLKDNIEMDIKQIPLIIGGLNRFDTQS
jgi:hypothetical protein